MPEDGNPSDGRISDKDGVPTIEYQKNGYKISHRTKEVTWCLRNFLSLIQNKSRVLLLTKS